MQQVKVAFIGNPNLGKTSLFNQLTGLRQRVGNYPGITVEKKTGVFSHRNIHYKLYDLPGIYSLYPASHDEEIAFEVLADEKHPDHPDCVVVVADATNLKRSLLVFEQVKDLGLPLVLAVNMIDEARKQGLVIDPLELQDFYQVPVVLTSARKGEGIRELKAVLEKAASSARPAFDIPAEYLEAVNSVQAAFSMTNTYTAWQVLARQRTMYLSKKEAEQVEKTRKEYQLIPRRLQVKETLERYKHIEPLVQKAIKKSPGPHKNFTSRLDKVLMHPVLGYLIFAALLLLIFQAIFSWSEWPMTMIENGFASLSLWVNNIIPAGPVRGLVADGIIPGIGGIMVFIPQILILFFFLLIMEETGYMSRVVFLMDKWMRPFGLNGKSVVPLMSGAACAIPAVMSARNIENTKERLVTILVTPFITCSARLPVYALLISLVIPDEKFLGFNLKGLVLLGMYAIGLGAALAGGWVFSKFIKTRYKSYLVMEIPAYKAPVWKNVFVSLWEKVSAFVFGAGKIILAISIILWVLASFGPGEKFSHAEQIIAEQHKNDALNEEALKNKVNAWRLENSYLGIMGKTFEPVIRPLGYDWKIGIGIISSFAAREVFVPTMATIYSISRSDEEESVKEGLRDTMKKEVHRDTGKPVFTLAAGISLLLFYAFAMMCMSTVAAVKRETKTWKWPLIQLLVMTALAYITALAAYQILT